MRKRCKSYKLCGGRTDCPHYFYHDCDDDCGGICGELNIHTICVENERKLKLKKIDEKINKSCLYR